jgi:hypothetical protein
VKYKLQDFYSPDLRSAHPWDQPGPTPYCQLCGREYMGGTEYGLRNGDTAWVCDPCGHLIAMQPPNSWDPGSIGKTEAEVYAEAGYPRPIKLET